MIAITLHQSELFLKSASNCLIILLAKIDCICSLTRALGKFLVLRPSFVARLSMWHKQGSKLGFQKIAAACRIISIMQVGLCFRSFIWHSLFNLIAKRYPYTTKLRLTSFLAWFLANSQVLIKVLLNFPLPILLNRKKRGNRSVLNKKTSFEAAFLILPLYNFFENAFLVLLLYLLIVSSSLHLSVAKSNVGVFEKDNVGKSKGNDLRCIGADADGRTRIDNPGIRTNADAKIGNLCTAADNPSIMPENLSTAANNPDIATNNPGIAADNQSTAANNPGIAINDPGIRIYADA